MEESNTYGILYRVQTIGLNYKVTGSNCASVPCF